MSSAFTIYQSTDASAPVLNTSAGTGIAVMDACLVNGYGAKLAAGWAKAFSGTNKAVYRAASGVRHYWRLLDDATTVPSGSSSTASQVMILNAYESMSDVDTGTNAFPTAAQQANPGVWKATGAACPWVVAADALGGYFFTTANSSGPVIWKGFAFGEFYSLQTNDSFRSLIRTGNSPVGALLDMLEALDPTINVTTSSTRAYVPRGHTGVGTAVNVSCTGDAAKGSGNFLKGIIPSPNPADGGFYISPVWIGDPTTAPANGLRGRMRGFWHFLHAASAVTNLQVLSGTGDLSGRTFLVLNQTANGGVFLIETSATLESNP